MFIKQVRIVGYSAAAYGKEIDIVNMFNMYGDNDYLYLLKQKSTYKVVFIKNNNFYVYCFRDEKFYKVTQKREIKCLFVPNEYVYISQIAYRNNEDKNYWQVPLALAEEVGNKHLLNIRKSLAHLDSLVDTIELIGLEDV